MANTPNLNLRLLEDGDADNVDTLNRNLEILDILANPVLLSATTTAQPGAPSTGDAYFVPASGVTGAEWSLNPGTIAIYVDNLPDSPQWVFVPPADGWSAVVLDANGGEGAEQTYSSASSSFISSGTTLVVNVLHPLTPAAGATRYPLFFATSGAVISQAVCANITSPVNTGGPTNILLPRIGYSGQLNAGAITTIVDGAVDDTNGWLTSSSTFNHTSGLIAADPGAVAVPAAQWVFYDIPAITGTVTEFSIHLEYSGV